MKRAGLAPWPRLFQNLRSTRATELADEFPGHVVSSWLGHSEDIAKEHYRQVTDDHFARATGYALPEMMPPDAVSGRTDSNSQTRPVPQPVSAQEETAACGSTQPLEMEDRGPVTEVATGCTDKGLWQVDSVGGAESGAVGDKTRLGVVSNTDFGIEFITEVWAGLSDEAKARLIETLQAEASHSSTEG